MKKELTKLTIIVTCCICVLFFYNFDTKIAFGKENVENRYEPIPTHQRVHPPPKHNYLSNVTSVYTYPSAYSANPSTSEVSPAYSSVNVTSLSTDRLQTHNVANVIETVNMSLQLRELIGKDILQNVPQTFDPAFKNPCWYDKYHNLQCFPYFYVAGMPKSGSTDIYSKIISHPDVVSSPKGLHWWTRRRYNHVNVKWYLSNQNKLARLVDGDPEKASRLVIGEGSTSTLWDNHILDKELLVAKTGPIYTNADVIHLVQPSAKIIAIFRNPTDRLYSDYKFFYKKETKSPQIYHSLVINAIELFNNCRRYSDVRKCTYTFDHEMRLAIGIYNVYIRDWLKVFPRDQLFFIRTDDWRDCNTKLLAVFQFLTLREPNGKEIDDICNQSQKNTNNQGRKKYGPMLQETRELLDAFYKPFLQDCVDVLDDVGFTWE